MENSLLINSHLQKEYLIHEYKRYVDIINNYHNHIDRCFNEHLISNYDRNNCLQQINESVQLLNIYYNEKLTKINNSVDNVKFKDDYIELNDNNLPNENKTKSLVRKNKKNINMNFTIPNYFIDIIDTWETLNIPFFKYLYSNSFDKIKDKLLKISEKFGFSSLEDALILLVGRKYTNMLNSQSINNFNLFNKVFIPLSYSIIPCNNTTNYFTYKIIKSEYEILLENYIEVKMFIPNINRFLLFKGYFKYDTINIIPKTLQINYPIIYSKKKQITSYIQMQNDIAERFRNNYCKNLTLYEILCLTKENIYDMMKIDYSKYLQLASLQFRTLMDDDFIGEKTSLFNQFKIIKILLTGDTEETNNTAALLFGFTKDKKLGNEFINNIIFRNLPFTYQTRLKKNIFSIKNELDKIKSLSYEEMDINKQLILNKYIPNYVKKLILEKSNEMKNGSSDYAKQKLFVDILLKFPWIGNDSNDTFKYIGKSLYDTRRFLDTFVSTMNNKIFGHNECKNSIKQLIGKWVSNPNSIGKSIGLYGPPGTGKTLIAKALGEALQIPFVQINLGGKEDRCELSGHSYTYSSAQPGLIVRKMVEAGKPRCIMYFDELDKACYKHGINEIFNVLIHVTDKNTNDKFSDSFFSEVSFPLNQVLFVFSYNDPAKVDKILLDRMEKIEVKPYSLSEKVTIVQDFLLKELADDIGIPIHTITINPSDIEYVIDKYTMEAGIRDLRHKLESLLLKLNLDRIYETGIFEKNNNNTNKYLITKETIDSHFNKNNNNQDKKINDSDEIGMINGLFATSIGIGGIIPIIVYKNYTGCKNKFSLKMTGSQGNIMKESIQFSFTTAMNLLKSEYLEKFYEQCPYGLHIHTPDGASPKDGPSAGSAFTIAFISRILGVKIKKDVAITGEIDINGKISAIGGLNYKIKGAQKAGVQLIMVPEENNNDLQEIIKKDPTINNNINIITVKHIKDALKYALVDEEYIKEKYDNQYKSNDVTFDINKYFN
jgi:endopeptidase La